MLLLLEVVVEVVVATVVVLEWYIIFVVLVIIVVSLYRFAGTGTGKHPLTYQTTFRYNDDQTKDYLPLSQVM